MSNIRIAGAVIGLLAYVVVHQHMFLCCPKMVRAGDTLTVGDVDGNHATYAIGERESFSSSSLGYDLSFTGSDALGELGSRGVISYLDSQLYAGALAQAKCSGGCMAGPLNAYESQGRIGHLLLIPADDAALASMKHTGLPSGAKFELTGHPLTYQGGKIDGHSFNGQLGNMGYFLVESIERE